MLDEKIKKSDNFGIFAFREQENKTFGFCIWEENKRLKSFSNLDLEGALTKKIDTSFF